MATTRIEFRQQRDFGDKISATFDFLRLNFIPIFRSIIFIAGPVILIGIGIFSILGNRIINSWDTLFSNGFSSDVVVFITLIGAAALYFSIIYTTIIAVVYSYIQLYLDESELIDDIQTVFEYTKANFITILTTTFWLIFLSIITFSFLAGFIFATKSSLLSNLLFLFLIPAIIYIAVTISLVFFIRVIENIGFFSAISRCFYLISGHWWRTFGYLFVMAIIQMFMGYAFQIPLMVYSESFPLLSLKSQESNSIYMIGYVVTFLFYLFGSQILHLLNLTALAFQYFNLVETKEGVGLMQRINRVGNTKINKDDTEDF